MLEVPIEEANCDNAARRAGGQEAYSRHGVHGGGGVEADAISRPRDATSNLGVVAGT